MGPIGLNSENLKPFSNISMHELRYPLEVGMILHVEQS